MKKRGCRYPICENEFINWQIRAVWLVSTILDALKRLEDKTRARHEKWIPGAMQGRGKAAGNRWRKPVVVVVAGLSIAGAALAAYWGYGKWARPVPVQKEAPADRASAQTTPPLPGGLTPTAPKAENAIPANRPKLPSNGAADPSASFAAAQSKTGVTAPPPVAAPEMPKRRLQPQPARHPQASSSEQDVPRPRREPAPAVADAAAAGTAQDPGVGSRADAQHPILKPVPPARQASPPPSLPTRDPYATAEQFTKDELHLQAISWTDVANTRITIINGQILREGQTVDGYAVVQIRPEHVILSKSQQYWKLGYRN